MCEEKSQASHLREGLDMMISDYLKSYSMLEFLTEIVPLCEANLHHKAEVHCPNDDDYDLGVRIKQMDAALLAFLWEFDLDLIVSSFIAQLRNHAEKEEIKDNQVLYEMYIGLADILNKKY